MKLIAMRNCLVIVLLLSSSATSLYTPGLAQASSSLFQQLINESGLRFSSPPEFTDIQPVSNPVLQYEHAIRHTTGEIEVRFVIRPIGRITIDYNDPHNASPEPNHLFPLLFESLINELSDGGNTPNKAYPQEQAKKLFNANWAAASVFDVNPDFSSAYSQGLLIGIHRDGQADAYTIFLFNDYSRAKPYINSALSSLSFTSR